MPACMRNPIFGFLYLFILWSSAGIGSVLIMFPLLPLMLLLPNFYRKIMDQLMGLWLILPVGLLEIVFDIKFYITGDKLRPKEGCLIMMNHRTTVDWLFFWEVLWQQGSVKSEKIVLKNMPKMVPGFGWAMQIAMYFFLKRRWDVDQPWMTQMLDYFRSMNYKAQFLIFPEGTDFDVKTKVRSDAYAKKMGLAIYDYVLHPRTTGFVYMANYLMEKNMIDAIYDVTVGYPVTIPTFGELDTLKGNLPLEVHFHIKRHAISTLSSDPVALETWCIQRWTEKEQTLEMFYTKNKKFSSQNENGNRHDQAQYIDRFVVWSVLTFWIIFYTFIPILFMYSVVARYHLLIGSIIMQTFYYFGGVESIAMSAYKFNKKYIFTV